jgi:uncharacterized protein
MKTPTCIGLSIAFALASTPARAETSILQVRDGPVTLAATLRLPDAPGAFTAVVMVPGSGCQTRAMLSDHADALVSIGLAVLSYDKRGCGESTGDWTAASLDDLTADAVAAVEELRRASRIAADRVGLWGISQGGWVVPLAAARAGTAFNIVVTGGGATPLEVEWHGYQSSLGRAQLSPEDVAEASAAISRYFGYLRCGGDRRALAADLEKAKERRWYAAAPLGRILPSETSRPAWQWVAEFDPSASISTLRTPTLVVLGGRDELVPADLAARRWQEALPAIGPSRVVTLADAGHGLRIGDHHHGVISEEYVPLLARWLAEAGVGPAANP